MKLPFNVIIGPILRPYLTSTRSICQNPTFAFSLPYTYFYSALGILISANHLKTHIGEGPGSRRSPIDPSEFFEEDFMLIHDLKIIATSMGLVQYACLLVGCCTENPALFLPHLVGQLIVVCVKMTNLLLSLGELNQKTFEKIKTRFPAIILMIFNWLQEFCVFRQNLCICDL